MPVRVFPGRTNRGGKSHHECGGHHSPGWNLGLNIKEEVTRARVSIARHFLTEDLGHLLIPCHSDFPAMMDCVLKP